MDERQSLGLPAQSDPALENLAQSAFDADYEFARHHRFALIENLPWTASLLADWMAGQLARMPIDETTANGEGHRLGATAAGDAVIPDGPFGVNSFRWKGKEYDAPDGKPFLCFRRFGWPVIELSTVRESLRHWGILLRTDSGGQTKGLPPS